MFFEYKWEYNMLFGCGAILQAGKKVKGLGCSKVLIVCDPGVRKLGIIDKLVDNLDFSGVESVIWDEAEPDPPDVSIDQCGAAAVAEKVDGIIGVGGGSAMDTAKAANALINNPPPINQWFKGVPYKPGVPVICIPTASGTGCEQSAGAIITDTRAGAKSAIVTPQPALAICDPELTLGMPEKLTLNSALDALAHCVETATTVAPSYYSRLIALDGIRTIKKFLPIVLRDSYHVEARERIMFAASSVSVTFGMSPPHYGHATGHSFGAKFHWPHGFCCIFCLPQIMEYLAPIMPDQVKDVAEAMGAIVPEGKSPEEIGKIASRAMQDFFDEVNAPRLKDMDVSLEDALSIIPMVYQDVMFGSCPVPIIKRDLTEIITAAYNA